MFQHERRQHPRYVLRLPVSLHRGGTVMSAEVVNASAGGCLLRVPEPLMPNEVVEVSIPEMDLPRARLLVLRSDAAATGYLVATCFEVPQNNEASVRQRSDEQQGSPTPPVLN